MKKLAHPAFAGLLAALLCAGGFAGHRVGAWRLPGIERLELWSLDLRFALRGPRPPGPETVILAYDDRSYAADPGLWERRAGWARVVRAAKAAGARVIGLDAIFAQPERLLPAAVAEPVEAWASSTPESAGEGEAGQLLRRVSRELRGDAELGAAIEEAGNVLLILHLGAREAADGTRQDPSLGRARYGQSAFGEPPPREARELIASLPALNRSARGLGYATVFEDETNTVRQVELARAWQGGIFAPLAVHAAARLLDVSRGKVAYLGPLRQVRIGERSIALDAEDSVWLNFRGPEGSFPTYSVIDLVEGRLPAGALDGKLVLVGMTHLGQDRTRTPFSTAVPGVELQATLVDNLLRGDPLRRAPWWSDALACLLLGVLAALLFLLVRAPAAQVAGLLLVLGAWMAASAALFSSRGLWLAWIGPAGCFAASGGVSLALSYLGEGRQKRRLRKSFAHYLGEEMIDQLLRNPGMLALGGERRELSVLFSDIRGFTTLSERLTPLQLVAFLNTYLTPMTRAVLGSGGFLDKYIGDAVMAVFGAPVPSRRHASQALECALRMHAELELLQPRLQAEGVELKIGVGVNTGEMVAGNMGAEERFDYTVVGDSVNLASRLEGLTKSYGVFCLVGDAARRAAEPAFRFREVDLVQVKGKHEPVAIHELLSGPQRTVAEYREPERFERALAQWRAGELQAAREGFAAFAALNPGDRVAPLYLERIAALNGAVPAGWNGVFVHTSK